MKTTLRKLFEEAMQEHGETWENVVATGLDTDPDEEFDNDFGRMEGGNGSVTTSRVHYSTYSDQGKKVILASLSHPSVSGEALQSDPLKALEELTERFLSAIRENFGDDAYLAVSEAVLSGTNRADDPTEETEKPDAKGRKKAGQAETKAE